MVTREARIEAIKVLISEGWNPPTPTERVMDKLADSLIRINRLSRITPAEQLVLYWAARGLSAPRTAQQLGLSSHTVKDQRKAAMHRLEARNITHAVAIAMREGLIAA